MVEKIFELDNADNNTILNQVDSKVEIFKSERLQSKKKTPIESKLNTPNTKSTQKLYSVQSGTKNEDSIYSKKVKGDVLADYLATPNYNST